MVPRAAFELTAGSPELYRSQAESGNDVKRAFCGACGSPLYAESTGRPERVALRAGALDDASWFEPTEDVWTSSAQPWAIGAGTRQPEE